jgi:hypothetical protein
MCGESKIGLVAWHRGWGKLSIEQIHVQQNSSMTVIRPLSISQRLARYRFLQRRIGYSSFAVLTNERASARQAQLER